MNDKTVSEVSRAYGVSARMLRYYEKEGLLTSKRRPGYAYRIYDEAAVTRLRQILLLRKLRFSLKQIAAILDAAEQREAVAIFLDQISRLDREIASLKVIRDVLSELAERGRREPVALDEAIENALASLPPPETTRKEGHTMSELNEANRQLSQGENVRIVRLPPSAVAAYQYVGENPEDHAHAVVNGWIRASGIYDIKPDARMYGFNHPSPRAPGEIYGYEFWVTIPPDLEVPEPLVKKEFPGGLYAVLAMDFPEFHRWQALAEWVEASGQYGFNYDPRGDEVMGGGLEDHLNGVYCANHPEEQDLARKLDLMLPVKKRG